MNGHSKIQECWQAAASHPSCAEIVSRTENQLVVKVHGAASHCLDNVGEDDPAICFDWEFSKLVEAVKVANQDWVLLQRPYWLPAGPEGSLTVESFQEALLKNIAEQGPGVPVGRFMIAQNNAVQYANIRVHLMWLMMGGDEFLSRICQHPTCHPLARTFVCADKENKATATATPFKVLRPGLGTQMFT